MKQERIKQMAETIENLKMIVTPAIMEFSLEEWKEVREHIEDRNSTIAGAAVVIDAMGGNSEMKNLKARFQYEMFEALYSYAKHLHKANEISEKIKEKKLNLEKNQDTLQELFS